MDLSFAFQRVGLAVALGLLVGLQREISESKLAGIRTYPLITVFGALMALMVPQAGGWVVAAGAISVVALLIIGNVMKMRGGIVDPGLTGEMSVLVMYAVGAYLVLGYASVAVAIGAAVALLNYLRDPLHGLVKRIGPRDLAAMMQFVLIALIILPVLPNKAYGPFLVLNPHKIWWMVVLIVAMSLVGYIAYKLFGAHAGALLGGVLGGMVSSTATTVSYSQRTKHVPDAVPLAAVVIMIASTIAFARVMFWMGVAAPGQFRTMAPPMIAMFALMAGLAAIAWFKAPRGDANLPEHENPTQLKGALLFAGLYAAVIFAVAATKHYFGNKGLYPLAIISGLTDMDAITLSASQLVHDGKLAANVGWRLVLLAALSNNVFKAIMAISLAHRSLAPRLILMFGISLVAGIIILFAWP